MDVSEQKTKLERQIVDALLQRVDGGTLTIDESMPIVDYSIEALKSVNTEEELTAFLSTLSGKWPMFNNLMLIKEGEKKEVTENEAVDKIIDLVKTGNLDQALDTAKQATSN